MPTEKQFSIQDAMNLQSDIDHSIEQTPVNQEKKILGLKEMNNSIENIKALYKKLTQIETELVAQSKSLKDQQQFSANEKQRNEQERIRNEQMRKDLRTAYDGLELSKVKIAFDFAERITPKYFLGFPLSNKTVMKRINQIIPDIVKEILDVPSQQ